MKHLKSAVSLLAALVLALSLSAGPASAAGNVLGTPTPLTEENAGVVDLSQANALAKNGYYTQEIPVGDTIRTAKVFLGSGAPLRCYFTVLNVPDGVDTASFLEQTGWASLAEQRGEGLFVLEPGEGGWGSYGQEKEYLTAAFAAYHAKTWYSNFGTSYLAGYGKGGTALQCYAMENSLAMISGVFVDASEISPTFLQAIGQTKWEDSQLTHGEIPMPVWLIQEHDTEQSRGVASYWKRANDCQTDGTAQADGSVVFLQKEDSSCIVTSYSDVRAKVRVQQGKADVYDPAFTQALYDFLSDYTRYESSAVAGNALLDRPDYEQLGVEIHQQIVDGLPREYLVYVPESVRNSGQKAPVVYLLGGTGQPNRVIFDATHWWEIAQQEGFIVVSPCAYVDTIRWNNTGDPGRMDDLNFFREMIAQVDRDYPVDTTRRYVTGQSNGAVMSSYLAQQMPEYFAAMAATSGGLIEDALYTQDRDGTLMPVYVLFGEHDLWDYDYSVDGKVRTLVDYWVRHNGAGDVDHPAASQQEGRFTTYGWSNEAGVALVQLTQTQGRTHNCIPSEMNLEWAWLRQWSRGADGVLYCGGEQMAAIQHPSQPDPQTPTAAGGNRYTVAAGDSLWSIAQHFYGSGAAYTKILQANQNQIPNRNRIYVGQILEIPD